MKDKNTSEWKLDNLSSSEALAKISDFRQFLAIGQSIFTIGSPPAELVLSLLEEMLIFGISFFGMEHKDIRARNLDMKIIYSPERFHSVEGYRYIDTGLPRTIRFGRHPRSHLNNEMLQEFLTNFLQDLIDVREIVIDKKQSLSFEDLEEILESRRRNSPSRRETTNRRPCSPIEGLVSQIAILQKRVKSLEASSFYLRRKLRQVTRKSS